MKKIFFLFMALASFGANAQAYTLNDFLSDVESGHEGVRGASAFVSGGKLREAEAWLPYSPQALMLYQVNDDKRETNAPAIMGYRTLTKVYSLGLGQQTPIGLNAKLAYNFYHTTVYGASPIFLNPNDFYFGGPSLELTQSLWRNFLGSEVRAQSRALRGQAQISRFGQAFKKKMLLLEAESAYWRLALARQNLKIAQESLGVAKKIRDWTQNRAGLQLGDRSDYLQAHSAFLLRQLEVKGFEDELHAAARAFNLARGRDSDAVTEELVFFDPQTIGAQEIALPEINREDLEAARVEYELAKTSHQLSLEKNRPTFEAFVNYSYNGRDRGKKEALSESFDSDYPNSTYGLRLQAPLDYFSLKKAQQGHHAEEVGAQLTYQRKKLELEREWNELKHRYTDLQERLTLLTAMEKAQKEKLSYERDRHTRGRTTTYQVLLFEQDYTTTAQQRIRTQAELLGVVAKMKTFGLGGNS